MDEKSDKSKIIAVPTMYFKTPKELMEYNDLNKSDKIKALKSWELTCNQLIQSTEEGMGKGEHHNALTKVKYYLRTLEH